MLLWNNQDIRVPFFLLCAWQLIHSYKIVDRIFRPQSNVILCQRYLFFCMLEKCETEKPKVGTSLFLIFSIITTSCLQLLSFSQTSNQFQNLFFMDFFLFLNMRADTNKCTDLCTRFFSVVLQLQESPCINLPTSCSTLSILWNAPTVGVSWHRSNALFVMTGWSPIV